MRSRITRRSRIRAIVPASTRSGRHSSSSKHKSSKSKSSKSHKSSKH